MPDIMRLAGEHILQTASRVWATARRHPNVFPLLLTRPAVTPGARTVRDFVLAALREAGLDEAAAARAERLMSTTVLGFAAGEAAGRFRRHDQAVIDEDFATLLGWLRVMVGAVPQ